MKTPLNPRSLALTLVLSSVALVLAGCGSTGVMPDSVITAQISGPPIQGSVFGGHAPISGSHIYLLQPGTCGIGCLASSILGTGTTSSPGGYTLQTNPATGGDPNIPAGWEYVISDSSGGFNLSNAYTCAAGQPVYIYSFGGNPGTVKNTAIAQMAILGNCPSNGALNFGSSSTDPINYVYMNEVSTVAAAYVFQPFTSSANDDAVHIGSSGTTQGLLGIENAADTAAQLYAIQGNGQTSSSNQGEGHLANFQTQLLSVPNAGNGIVPQATIDTLANILAACIDDGAGASSSNCKTLFTNATNDGTTNGTAPTDTATAAIYIARYPAGNFSGKPTPTKFVSALFGLQGAVVPFAPALAVAPNDFTVVIYYPQSAVGGYTTAVNPALGLAENIAVDNIGQIWITARNTDTAVRWSHLGVQNAINTQGYAYGNISIDGSNNALTGNVSSTTSIEVAGSTGLFASTYGLGFTKAKTVVSNSAGDAFFFASNAGTPNGTYNTFGNYEMWRYNSSGTVQSSSSNCGGQTGSFVYYCTSEGSILSAGANAAHGAIEAAASTTTSPNSAGHLWITSKDSPNYQIARVSPTGVKDFVFSSTQEPDVPSLDRNGYAWVPIQAAISTVNLIKTQTTRPYYNNTTLLSTSGNTNSNVTTGAILTWTFGSAIDGNNNLWLTNRCGGYGSCTKGSGTSTIVVINTANQQAISPPANYLPEAQYPATATSYTPILNDPLNIAIDPSGNVWITNYLGNSVAEMVGAAAPVVTPLSVAAGSNKLGTTP